MILNLVSLLRRRTISSSILMRLLKVLRTSRTRRIVSRLTRRRSLLTRWSTILLIVLLELHCILGVVLRLLLHPAEVLLLIVSVGCRVHVSRGLGRSPTKLSRRSTRSTSIVSPGITSLQAENTFETSEHWRLTLL